MKKRSLKEDQGNLFKNANKEKHKKITKGLISGEKSISKSKFPSLCQNETIKEVNVMQQFAQTIIPGKNKLLYSLKFLAKITLSFDLFFIQN